MKSKPREKTNKTTNHPTQDHWHEMNRKQRREMMRQIQSEDLSLEVVLPDAAGIDIGNESHHVAVPPSRDSQPVRRFGCTTGGQRSTLLRGSTPPTTDQASQAQNRQPRVPSDPNTGGG